EPTDKEREFDRIIPFDAEKEKEVYGLKQPLITDDLGITPQEALVFYPTLTISGMESGYNGEGTKTVLPHTAKAKLDFRLVPGYTATEVEKLLRAHLDKHGFEDVQIELLTELTPFRIDLEDPYVDIVVAASEENYGADNNVLDSESGGGCPMDGCDQIMNVTSMGTGISWAKSNDHAPIKKVRLQYFYESVAYMKTLLEILRYPICTQRP